MSLLRSSSTRGRSSASNLLRRIQSEVRKVAVSGDKNIFLNISPERKAEYGVTVDILPELIQNLNAELLYEIVYGGTSSYFDSDVFTKQREDEAEYLANSTRTLDVEASIYQCPRCKYNKIIVDQKLLRSMDEGMSALMVCSKCEYNWRKD